MFKIFLELGLDHILDFAGYDHILFILALCTGYLFKDIKKILILVTAFTIGHTCTLALATLNIINIPSKLIEVLIPVTILATSIYNLLYKDKEIQSKFNKIKYFSALFFGLIHGLGFSNYLRALLSESESIILPLFSFNLGLEAGQIIIVSITLLITFLLVKLARINPKYLTVFLSILIALVSIKLIIERLFDV